MGRMACEWMVRFVVVGVGVRFVVVGVGVRFVVVGVGVRWGCACVLR